MHGSLETLRASLAISDAIPGEDAATYDVIHGRCLLVRRTWYGSLYYLNRRAAKKPTYGGAIGLFGGKYEAGLDSRYFGAVIMRELKEETGFDFASKQLDGYCRMETDENGERTLAYYAVMELDRRIGKEIQTHLAGQRGSPDPHEPGRIIDDGDVVQVRDIRMPWLFGLDLGPWIGRGLRRRMMPTTFMLLHADAQRQRSA